MVWLGLNTIALIGDGKCGTLLSDIANGIKPARTTSVFNSTDTLTNYNLYNLTNSDLMNPFNYSKFQTIDGTGLPPVGSGILSTFEDLIGISLFNVPRKNSGTNANTHIDTAPQVQLVPPTSTLEYVNKKLAEMWNQIKDGISSVPQTISNWLNKLVSYATSFIGKVNNDREGNQIFSGGKVQAWCADFVTYCVKKTLGNRLPSDFGSSAVSGLRDWGIKHGCYTTAPEPRTEAAMKNYIKTKVKPGDIMIQKRNGRSHTGIVQSVASDGSSYTVVEGNSSDKVQTVTYNATNGYLSGFVSLAQYA